MPKDASRTARLRDNKRRYRTRQKEYIADLERRLRETRQEGIQATKEVQLSARAVVRENVRLRQLLRHVNVDENTINSWTQQDVDNVVGLDSRLRKACLLTTPSDPAKAQPIAGEAVREIVPSPERVSSGIDAEEAASSAPPCTPMTCHETSKKACSSQQAKSDIGPSVAAPSGIPQAPCKLVSQLAANPRTDIMQIPIDADAAAADDEGADGVECSRAYQMLKQYGTTDEKLDTIAVALERGCVANKGSRGGCRVKNEAIWKALDDVIH